MSSFTLGFVVSVIVSICVCVTRSVFVCELYLYLYLYLYLSLYLYLNEYGEAYEVSIFVSTIGLVLHQSLYSSQPMATLSI